MHTTSITAIVRPHELVDDPDYFRGVLQSMRNISTKELCRVRFGLTGQGIAPNYEITVPDGNHLEEDLRFAFNGRTHRTHHHSPEHFDPAHLTEKFTWDDVLGMLARCLDRKKAA